MKDFVLFYANAGCSDSETLVFVDNNLESAFAFAKRLCDEHNKTFLGVVDRFCVSKLNSKSNQ